MEFSEQILNKAIVSVYDELAWKKKDVFQAIDELIENNFAILGGDVWGVEEYKHDVPILPKIDHSQIAVGIIKGKDGRDYVYNWYSNKKKNESWQEYVLRSKIETINSINQMNAEDSVAEEYENSIYYNLVFADKSEYENLK